MSEPIVEGQDVEVTPEPADTYAEPIPHLREMFIYHAPAEGQVHYYQMLRESAENFARVIERYVPKCADRSAAIRHLREALMTANAAVALKGKV